MSNLILRIISPVLVFLLGLIGKSTLGKLSIALLTGSSIYAKDTYYLKIIEKEASGLKSFSIIGDFLSTSLITYIPAFFYIIRGRNTLFL